MITTKNRTRPSPHGRPSPHPRGTPSPEPDETVADGAAEEAVAEEATTDEATDEAAEATTTERIPAEGQSLLRRVRSDSPRSRASLLAVLVACVVLLGAASVWFVLEEAALRSGEPEENAALVDSETTETVVEEISRQLKAVFSYNYASPDRTRRAADRALLERAAEQYQDRFGQAMKAAQKRELVRTASVREIGVRAIHGDTARILVFLDQQTLTKKDSSSTQQTVSLLVKARRVDGGWKIAEFGRG